MDNQQRAKELSAKRAPTSNNAATCGAWGKSHSSSNGRCRSRRSYMGTVESHFQNSPTCPHSCRLPTPHPALQHTKALGCPGWTGSFPHKLSQAPHDSLYVLFSFVTATWECFETPQWGKTLPENGARPFHFWLLDSWPLTWHPGPWSLSHTLNKTVWVWGIKTSDMFKSWKLNKLWDAMFRIWNMWFPWADKLQLVPVQMLRSLAQPRSSSAVPILSDDVSDVGRNHTLNPTCPQDPQTVKTQNWWDLMRIPRVTISIYTILRYRKYE